MTDLVTQSEEKRGALARMFDSLRSAALSAQEQVKLLDGRIAELRAKRAVLETAIPHVDDLAEWICRNIDRHRDYFLSRAAQYLHPAVVEKRGWSALDDPEVWRNGLAVFRIDESGDGTPKGYLTPPDRDVRNVEGGISSRALIALLAGPLKAGARDFVLALLPNTANGMRRAEREQGMAVLDEEIRTLADRRQKILDELRKAGNAG